MKVDLLCQGRFQFFHDIIIKKFHGKLQYHIHLVKVDMSSPDRASAWFH